MLPLLPGTSPKNQNGGVKVNGRKSTLEAKQPTKAQKSKLKGIFKDCPAPGPDKIKEHGNMKMPNTFAVVRAFRMFPWLLVWPGPGAMRAKEYEKGAFGKRPMAEKVRKILGLKSLSRDAALRMYHNY